MNVLTNSSLTNSLINYDSGLLKKQIAENSRKIDEYLMELKELEYRLNGKATARIVA